MIKVLIVEDSPVERALLEHVLTSDPQIAVAGVAKDGEEALSAVKRLKPDIITMDIHMPNLNGFETTRLIMEENPVPIVIVSGSVNVKDADKTFRAMEAGALALVQKPRGIGHPSHPNDAKELLKTVKTLSEVKVVRRWPRLRKDPPPLAQASLVPTRGPVEIRIVAIGASTGGPAVLHSIFTSLPKNLGAPVLVVQHMAAGFMEGFVSWLGANSGFPVQIASHGELPMPGRAYFAPDDMQMSVGRDGRVLLSRGLQGNGSLCPSVSRLFGSVAEVYGRNAVGVLLTGMGRDGADELKEMRDRGAVTIAQDMESSVVYGMPGEAARIGAADYVAAPDRIVELIAQLVSANRG